MLGFMCVMHQNQNDRLRTYREQTRGDGLREHNSGKVLKEKKFNGHRFSYTIETLDKIHAIPDAFKSSSLL